MSIESMMPSNHLILSSLLLLSSILPSTRVFFNESTLYIRWPKYWSFSISPSNEYSGLISFRIDRFDLFAVQRTLKSLLQHHSSKASVLWCLTSVLWWQYTALTYSFPGFEPVSCFMSSSNYCFLICIEASQEAGKVVWLGSPTLTSIHDYWKNHSFDLTDLCQQNVSAFQYTV